MVNTVPSVSPAIIVIAMDVQKASCSKGSTPGCLDPECEAAVCPHDPYCCAVLWDAECAALAASSPTCACAGSCCDANGTPGCSEAWWA